MKAHTKLVGCRSERGVALIIALFTLMLISAVATALILMTGTAAAIKGNYKSSIQAFYDAKAGLEEGRSRLWRGNPNTLGSCVSNPMPSGQVCYITNPDAAAGETSVDPKSQSDQYYDTEYDIEFGQGSLAAASVSEVASTSPLASPNIAGPPYKWVRITPRTETSAGVNLNGTRPGTGLSPLYYDGSQQTTLSTNNSQVLTVTALAVTPNAGYSGRRLLQYAVAQNPDPDKLGHMLDAGSGPPPLSSIFQAALTLDGNGATYNGQPQNSSYNINGNDSSAQGGVGAIGYTNVNDATNISAQPTQNYQSPQGVPSVGVVTLPTLMSTPAGMDSLVQEITLVADKVVNPMAGVALDQSTLPSAMISSIPKGNPPASPPPCSPMIAVVNGDFHLTHPNGPNVVVGCGLLIVTGTFYYDPDDYWFGVILIVGKGVFDGTQYGNGGSGTLNGALVLANTRDPSGNLLSALGPVSFKQTGGNGIRYNSYAMNQSQALLSLPYQVLSFREVQLTQ